MAGIRIPKQRRVRHPIRASAKELVMNSAKGAVDRKCAICGKPAWWHLQRRSERMDDGHDYDGFNTYAQKPFPPAEGA